MWHMPQISPQRYSLLLPNEDHAANFPSIFKRLWASDIFSGLAAEMPIMLA
jgi:hypothetical protein